MKIKKFNEFENIDESKQFNWKEYGEKREIIMVVIPKLIEKIKPLKEFGKRIFHQIAYREIGGSYMRELQIKYGFNHNMMHEIYNQINSLDNFVGPNLNGEFKMVKATLWDKIFGTKSMRVVRGTSIVDHLIALLPEFHDELLKKEKDIELDKLVSSLWNLHQNNPKNKKNVKLKSDNEITNENRKDMYDEYEWQYKDEKRIGTKPNEKYFLNKANNYKQMMINLSNMVLNYKEEVIKSLEPYMNYIDKKTYNSLLKKIDDLYNYINGDSSHIKGEKTRLQYSIVELLDKYINKDNTNYKTFF